MPLEPLLPLFHRLDRQYFDSALGQLASPALQLRWSDGRLCRSAGLYRFGPHLSEIVLSQPLLVPLPPEATLSTLCHEMIHAWVDRILLLKEVHGPQFRARMASINSVEKNFQVSLRHSYPMPLQAAAWWACCGHCGKKIAYRRRRKGLACRNCCELHNAGVWDVRFALNFSPNHEASSR